MLYAGLYVGIWDILHTWSHHDIVSNIEISGVSLQTALHRTPVRNSQNRNIHIVQPTVSSAGSDLDFALIVIGLIDHNNE